MVLLAVGVVFVPRAVPWQSSHFVFGLYQRYFLCLGVLSSLWLFNTYACINISIGRSVSVSGIFGSLYLSNNDCISNPRSEISKNFCCFAPLLMGVLKS